MIAALLLVVAQVLREEPSQRLPEQHPGAIVLRGSDRAPIPAEIDAKARLRIVLGDAHGPGELALAPHDWIADAPATVERLNAAEAFEFAGGSPYRLLEALYPKKSEGRAIQVIREHHRLGAAVIGTGRGAGFVSALTFAPVAERERRERNPRRTESVTSLWSLSILPWALVATDEETAGELEPFYGALLDRHLRTAFFLAPEATLAVDPVRGEALVSGEGGVWLFDLKRARRDRTGFSEGRISWLCADDRWDVRTRLATLAPGAELSAERGLDEPMKVERALSTESLRRALARFLESPVPRVLRLNGADAELTFTVDVDTRLSGRRATLMAIDRLRVDLRLAAGHTRP